MPVRMTGIYGINGREWCCEWRWIIGSDLLMAQLYENGPGDNSAVLKITCYGAAAALCAVTVAANLKFGLTLGSTPEEKAIYATASVAADVFKCTMVMVVIRLWQKRQRWLAGVGAVFGVALLDVVPGIGGWICTGDARAHRRHACRHQQGHRRVDDDHPPRR